MKSVGWRKWVVAWMCCFIGFLQMGPARLSGILFPSVMLNYGADRTQASFPFFLCFAVRSLSGPVIGYLGDRFGLRLVTMIGCLTSFTALGLCFFVESIVSFTILWGGVYGLGVGLGTLLLPPILNQYFERRTSMANGILLLGESLSGFTLPVLLEFLIKDYGLPGAMLILSGMMLNSVPIVMLLRKSGDSTGRREVEKAGVMEGSIFDQVFDDTEIIDCSNAELTSRSLTERNRGVCSTRQETEKDIVVDGSPSPDLKEKNDNCSYPSASFGKDAKVESNLSVLRLSAGSTPGSLDSAQLKWDPTTMNLQENRFTEISEGTQPVGDKYASTDNTLDLDLHRDNTEMFCKNATNTFCDEISDTENVEIQRRDIKKDISPNVLYNFRKTIRNFKTFQVFIDPAFLLILVNQSCFVYIFIFFNTIFIDFFKDGGVDENRATYLLVVLSITDAAGRFFLGMVTDSGLMSNARFCFLGYTGMGITLLLLNWFSGYIIIMIVLSFYGFFFGGILCTLPGVCSESILPEQLTVALASRYFLFGPMSFTQSPLIGLFRSQWGSYKPIIIMLSVLSFACAFMSAAIPSAARRRDERRKKAISGREGEPAT